MAASDMPLMTHPAGRDVGLRVALEDLLLGRWRSTRNLLAATGGDRVLRTSRSQVLAAVAASGDAVDAWRREEPGSGDGLMMWARVLTQRALDARDKGGEHRAVMRAGDAARRACHSAAASLPGDPVPGVCLLALAQLDVDARYQRHPENWAAPPETALSRGPWTLLEWVNRLDPGNREAHHRMLQCFHARRSGAMAFARYAAAQAPGGSPLWVLPLYAYAEDHRLQLGGPHSRDIGYWISDDVTDRTRHARDLWFYDRDRRVESTSLADLTHLAYVLHRTRLPMAGRVFEEIGPYATAAPWDLFSGDRPWEDDFRRARASALRREPSRR